MNVIVLDREPMKVVGMVIRTDTTKHEIPELWEKFIPRMEELEANSVPECSLGICLQDSIEENDEFTEFSYLAARVVRDDSLIPEGMEYYEVKGGLTAVFTHEGSLDTLADTYEFIYEKWLEESDYELAEGDELEWYDSRFIYNDPKSKLDIHIPVKLKKDPSDIEQL